MSASVVAHFSSTREAHVAKAKLELAGLACEIVLERDEAGVTTVLLIVAEEDLERAQRLLVEEEEDDGEPLRDEEAAELEYLSDEEAEAAEEAALHAEGLHFAKRFMLFVVILLAILFAIRYFEIR